MSAGTSKKETLQKTVTFAKSRLKVSKAKLQQKIKSVDGLERILPRNFRKPAAGEQLILENHSVLYLSYLCVVAIAVGVFVGQWTYYSGMKETITDITDDSSSNEYDSCKALQADPVYNMKWTYESCKEKEANGDGSYAKLSDATSIVEYGSWGGSGWGYKYFPFKTSSMSLIVHGRDDGCALDAVVPDATIYQALATGISTSATYVHNASCSQYIDQTQCAVNYASNNVVDPQYVLLPSPSNTSGIGWYQYTTIKNGVTFNNQGGFPPPEERCVAYEKECSRRAFEVLFENAEACHPCYVFKDNSPFLCIKSKGKTTLEILSLSVSNTLAAFSFLVALVPVILSSFADRVSTMRVSKEERDDDGEDVEDDSV